MTDIRVSSIFTRTRKANTRVIVHEGGSRSSKTFSIIQYLIYLALEKRRKITIARAKMTWVRPTVYLDFLDILQNHYKIYNEKNLHRTEMTYTFANGSMFQFIGCDDKQRLHGFKSDIIHLNECIEIGYPDYNQLAMRTTEKIIIDYNPSATVHWIFDKVIPRDDCTFIKSTFLDNPFLEQSIVDEIKRLEPTPKNIKAGTADETLWSVYGLGERAAHKGLIYKVNIVESLPPQELWKKCVYGLDFGFTNDPSTLVQVVMSQGELYLKEIFYARGLVNRSNNDGRSIEEALIKAQIPKDAVIYCDSAEPKSIQELQNAGWYHTRAAVKGPDSILNGIANMKRYTLNVTSDSINLLKETQNYKWVEINGELTNKPIDAYNHALDAARYSVSSEFRLIYEDKYTANNPNQIIKKVVTLQDKIKNMERRANSESYYNS